MTNNNNNNTATKKTATAEQKTPKQKKVGPDPNMDTAWRWGWAMMRYPNAVRFSDRVTPKAVAELVNIFDGDLVRGDLLRDLHPYEAASRCKHVSEVTFRMLEELSDKPQHYDANFHTSIGLRLWAACISSAKVVAKATRSGPNTEEYRRRASYRLIKDAERDVCWKLGIKAGPWLKELRNEEFFFDGIPNANMRVLWPEYWSAKTQGAILSKMAEGLTKQQGLAGKIVS